MSLRGAFIGVVILVLAGLLTFQLAAGNSIPNRQSFNDSTGTLKTYSTLGSLDLSNAFFQSLGTNGRSCASCHAVSDAWSISAAHVQQRFQDTQGPVSYTHLT